MKKCFSIVFLLAFAFPLVAATNVVPKNPLAVPVASRGATNGVAHPPVEPVKVAWETFPQPGNFIMSLARDGAGNVWAVVVVVVVEPAGVAEVSFSTKKRHQNL